MEDVYHTPIQNIQQSLRRGRTIEEVNSMTETYLFESPNGSPSRNNRSQNSTKRYRLKRQNVVEEDLYDEDHYSLPNLSNSVTKSAGRLQVQEDEQETKEYGLKKKKIIMMISLSIILTLVIIGIITVLLILNSGEFLIFCHILNFIINVIKTK